MASMRRAAVIAHLIRCQWHVIENAPFLKIALTGD